MVNTASAAYIELVGTDLRELHRHMVRGARPEHHELAGREFRGTNVPATSRLLGIRRFIKGFEQTSDGDVIGYNRRVKGADISSAWQPSPWRGIDRFGWFSVSPVDPTGPDNVYLNALLLDYGSGLNPPHSPTAILRDYLVRAPFGGLLGRAYLAVGRRRLPVGYFVLEAQ